MNATGTEYVLSVRLPDDLAERAKHLAAVQDRSLSSLIRRALTLYVEELERPWPVKAAP